MSTAMRVFGSELSPYSVKVRSYLRYKGIAHEWVVRNTTNQSEFDRYAKLPLIPLVVMPDGTALQDSTPIIEHFERLHSMPSIHPADPALAFVSALIEEYADEWGNKPMFHFRWFYPPDQESAAKRIATSMMPGLDGDGLRSAIDAVKGRMVSRLALVGSSPATKDQIEASFHRQLAILERHIGSRPYLFGGRPAFGDFGLAAQLYQCSTDPTPGAIMRRTAPATSRWVERMLVPSAAGDFEPWAALAPTLQPLLADEIAAVFLPWTTANARALAAGEKHFALELGGRPFRQETQRYHAKSLAVLRSRYGAVPDRSRLDPLLTDTGCLPWLRED